MMLFLFLSIMSKLEIVYLLCISLWRGCSYLYVPFVFAISRVKFIRRGYEIFNIYSVSIGCFFFRGSERG